MYFAGIDVGAYFTKVIVMDEGGVIIAKTDVNSGAAYERAVRQVTDEACSSIGISRSNIDYAVLTGIGNKGVAGKFEFKNEALITDISCQSTACSSMFPECHTVIDVGGGSSKVIVLDEYGCCEHFVFNEKCATGSGRFMQVIANMLEIEVEDIGELSLRGTEPISFTTGCAVFAESDVITKIGEGVSAENILAGMNLAIGGKIVSLVKRVGFKPRCVMTGGASRNKGLIKAVSDILGAEMLVPDDPEFSCAYGAAISAISRARREGVIQ